MKAREMRRDFESQKSPMVLEMMTQRKNGLKGSAGIQKLKNNLRKKSIQSILS